MDWFDIDKEGLRKLIEGRGYAFVLYELLQNAYDEQGVTKVEVELHPVEGKRQVRLLVRDDAPEGFKRISDAWTLFAESYKKGNPEQRGRFNLGEKLVLALCEQAEIQTTSGTVRFGPKGRTRGRKSLDKGTFVALTLKATKAQAAELEEAIHNIIVPQNVVTTFNGEPIPRMSARAVFEPTLPTVFSDEEGVLHKTTRKTVVAVYDPNGAGAWLYEMGIPVVPIEAKWSIDVQQKVPLNMDRDNITPGYKLKILTHLVNEMHEDITEAEASDPWVKGATSNAKEISDDAYAGIMDKRHGEDAVMRDMHDPEANSAASAHGVTVIQGNQLSEGEREKRRKMAQEGNHVMAPAGRIYPSQSNEKASYTVVDPLTPGMERVVTLTKWLGGKLLHTGVTVKVIKSPAASTAADWGGSTIRFNLSRLGHAFFDATDERAAARVLSLIVHEFGHNYESNHLSEAYYRALTDLGARLALIPELHNHMRDLGYKVGGAE